MREEAITSLRRHLNAVISKRAGQAIGLWGEAGVGKTFTVQALLGETPLKSLSLPATLSDSALVLSLPRPAKRPQWTEALRERILGGQSITSQALLETLTATLAALAPFVLHLEDLHEASPQRLELVQKLGKIIPRLRGVGLLVTSRSQPPEPFSSYYLQTLSEADCNALLEAQAGRRLPPEGLAWVYRRTQGNPLFTLEFWRYLTRQGFFWSDGSRWHWRTPGDHFMPVSVEALISQMIQGLQTLQASRAVLEARAIFPQEIAREIGPQNLDAFWARVAGVDQPTLALSKRLLRQQGFFGGDQFAHPLFQEVALRETPLARQQAYARQALEALGNEHPELAAAFVEQAGIPPDQADQAVALLERAAQAARERGDLGSTAQWLIQATQFALGEARGRLALAADQALQRSGRVETRIRLLEMALADLPPNPDTTLALAMAYTAAGQLTQAEQTVAGLPSGQYQQDWLKQQIILWQRMGKVKEAFQVWQSHPELEASIGLDLALARSVASIYSGLGQQDQAQAIIEQALSQASPDTYNRICLLDMACTIHERKHDFASAKHYFDQALAQEFADPDLLAMVLSNGSGVLRGLGQYQAMVENLEQALGLYAQAGRTMAYHNTGVMLSWALIELGQYERAEGILHQALEYFLHQGKGFMGTVSLVRLRHLYLDWNPPHGPNLARKYAYMALERGRASPDVIDLINGLVAVALYEATVGSASEALKFAQEGLGHLSMRQIPGLAVYLLLSQGMALARLGQPAQAEAALRQALALQGDGQTLEAQKIHLQLDRLNGDLQAAAKRLEWFEQNGLTNGANLVRRYFPQLGTAKSRPVQEALRLQVLGPVGLVRGEEPLAYRGKRRLELLCYLLEARIAGHQEVSVLELGDVFYPGAPEAEAKATLKQQVYLIRVALGKDSVHSTANGYALGAIGSDAEDFLQGGEVSLWRGAYLERLSEGWLGGVREALVQALYDKTRGLIQGNPAEAARLGQILMGMEPYDTQFLQLTLQANPNPKATARLYREAQARFLEVGESLPARLEDFLPTVSSSG